MAEPALQLPPEEDNEIDISDQIRQRDGDNAIDISDQIRARDAVPDVNESPDGQQPSVVDRAQDLKDQFDQGKELYGKGKEKLAARTAGKKGLQGVEKETVKKAVGKKVATQGAEGLAKAGAKTAATTAAKAGATTATLGAEAAAGPVGWVAGAITIASIIGKPVLNFVKNNWQYAVYIVAALLLLLAIPFGLLGGKGSPQYPATQAQQDQITALSAVSGNSISRTKLIFDSITAEKKRMAKFKIWVSQIYSSNAGKASSATARIKEVTSLLDTFEATTVAADKKKIVVQIKERLSTFSTDFPELVGFGAINGYPLDVPGVIESEGGDCGAASILMVSLYYKQNPSNDVYNAPKKASRANICVSPGYLNGHSPYQDWDYATSSRASFTSVKKSLAAGNPVILYTKAGGIYGPSSKGFGGKHIVVIVGYDPADQSFFINNPSPKKVDVATKIPNGRLMTESHLQQFLGDTEYGHTYIIRKAYL